MSFSNELHDWYLRNKRDLPWRNTRSPYLIFLSEVILQQTRVNQGIGYYRLFAGVYPGVADLAAAPEDEVLNHWQGLGYYSRARNMLHTARTIVEKYNGLFPDSYSELLKLKGVGPYIAAAIASFAFNLPVAVLDGNVYRVLSRYFGIDKPIDSSTGKNIFRDKADELLDTGDPATHNQAIMEFGALQCVPVNPNCSVCIFNTSCVAYLTNMVARFPVKGKKPVKKIRYLYYYMFYNDHDVVLQKRTRNDIWKMLYEFPLMEGGKEMDEAAILGHIPSLLGNANAEDYRVQDISPVFSHQLTHQTIRARFVRIIIKGTLLFQNPGTMCIPRSDLGKYAVPRLIDRFLGCIYNDV